MCTPWTLSKIIRCKPCFSQHNCPPGDGSETLRSAVGSDAGKRSMIDGKVLRQTEFGKEGVSDHSMLSEDGLPDKNKRYELRLRRGFEDERYIVFCFGEEESVNWNDDNKLEVFDDCGNGTEGLNDDKQEDGEEEASKGNSQTERRLEDNSDSGTGSGSIRSRNSDISGGSSGRSRKGSFSFPVLNEEWIGSPAQMPRPEDLLPSLEEEPGYPLRHNNVDCAIRKQK